MPNLLPMLRPYLSPTLLRVLAAAPRDQIHTECFPAAVLFVDVSGFTSLTESLAQRGPEGAEELTRLLSSYFTRMITLLHSEGGEIAKFSGDALTVLFPAGSAPLGHAVRRAYQAAAAMQAAMVAFEALPTSVGSIALGMKIGIGAGEVVTLRVGGVFGRWEYVVAGEPLRQVAAAESLAQPGEARLSAEATALMHPEPLPACPLVPLDLDTLPNPQAIENLARGFIPGALLSWLQEGLSDWVAVLRSMTVLFAGVGGLDYTQPDAPERLQALVQAVQEIIYRYEGSLNKVVVDDKGTVLLALFGAPPLAHKDDAERAVRAALDIQAQMTNGPLGALGLRVALGLASGRVFAGPVGSELRREYTAIGDTVNLAARLMGQAGAGRILCDAETTHRAQQLSFETLAPVQVKGKADLVPIFCPHAAQSPVSVRPGQGHAADSALVGREAELARLVAALEALQAGQGQVLVLEGEAGIGKSRLIIELEHHLPQRGLLALPGMGLSIEQNTPYRAWRAVLTSYFELEGISALAARQARAAEVVQRVAPEHLERLPLLNDVLGLSLPDTPLTAALDPALRQQNLTLLVIALLQARASAQPVLLVIEDAHWLDSLSWELTVQVGRALLATDEPLLLLLATRPYDAESAMAQHLALLGSLAPMETLHLGDLPPEAMIALVTDRLDLAPGDLPTPLAELVRERAGGNPFYAEELIFTLRDQRILSLHPDPRTLGRNQVRLEGDLARATTTLPDTIQGLILARIDNLPPERQLVLKISAVIGRIFGYRPLCHVVQQYLGLDEASLKHHLDALAALDLTPLDAADEHDRSYIFKHIITQEVAYQTLLHVQRRQLHQAVADWYEQAFSGSALEPHYALLVHHYHHAEQTERERHYARLSGERAAAQFANVEAVRYLSRALELTAEADMASRAALLRVRERVYDLQGARADQQADLDALHNLAERLDNNQSRGDTALRQANYAELMGDYEGAAAAVQRAIVLARQQGDTAREAAACVQGGTARWRQGDLPAAQEQLTRALELARQSGSQQVEADTLRHLANLAVVQGQFAAASTLLAQAQALCQQLGDRLGESRVLNVLGAVAAEQGDYAAANRAFTQYIRLCHLIGDRVGESRALINLGVIASLLGAYAIARTSLQNALRLCQQLGNRWGEGWSLLNLGLILHHIGSQTAAQAACERALQIARQSGDRNSEGYALTFLGHALAAQQQLDAAVHAYAQALDLRNELEQFNLAVAPLAGLARVAQARGDLAQARVHVAGIQGYLERATLALTDEPVRVYLTCYHVLHAHGDPLARTMLETASALLRASAERIGDDASRESFLHQIQAHQEVLALATQLELSVSA